MDRLVFRGGLENTGDCGHSGGMAATLDSIRNAVLNHPGVLEATIEEDVNLGTLNIELQLVRRDFDLEQFKSAMRDRLPVAVRFNVAITGQTDPYKPNPFEHVVLRDYDVNMSDAELALRLKTLRG